MVDTIIEILSGINVWSTIFRIFLAVMLGGIIGFERGHHGRAAGLRTHILVCLGSTMASLVGLYTATVLQFTSDPMRVGAQVVSGIGFLGVGTIMVKEGRRVTGLTTAAGLWATASIGLAIGIGYYIAALAAFFAVIITMAIFVYLDRTVKIKKPYDYYLELDDVYLVNSVYESVRPINIRAEVVPPKSGISSNVGMELKVYSQSDYDELMEIVSSLNGVVISIPMKT